MDATQPRLSRTRRFDAAVVPYVLTVVPDPRAMMDEIVRVAEAGGEHRARQSFRRRARPDGAARSLARPKQRRRWAGIPQFPFAVLGDWLAATPGVRLVERRTGARRSACSPSCGCGGQIGSARPCDAVHGVPRGLDEGPLWGRSPAMLTRSLTRSAADTVGRPSPAALALVVAELRTPLRRPARDRAMRFASSTTTRATWVATPAARRRGLPRTTPRRSRASSRLCAAHRVPDHPLSAPAPRSKATSTRPSAASRSIRRA